MSMLSATVPNIDPQRDHAFTLDTGETVVVRIERVPHQPPGGDVAIRVTPRLVDPTTGATLQVAGTDVIAPSVSATITLALFDAPSFDVTSYLAGLLTEQAPRARAYHAALTSLASIAPAAS